MSQLNFLSGTIDICCPSCDEDNEVEEVTVSVTVENRDVGRLKDESAFVTYCEHCNCKIVITAELDIKIKEAE